MAKKKKSALNRYMAATGAGSLVGGGIGAILGGPKTAALSALRGAVLGGGGAALGDAIMGDDVEDRWDAAGHGMVGGGALGGAAGGIIAGAHPRGMNLVKHLMQKGLSKNKAMALILGGASLAGGALGGIDSGAYGQMGYDFTEGE